MGRLLVRIVENGHSCRIECDECTLVEAVQKFLELACGILFNDQLLLCLDSKLEARCPLSAYKLPSDEREVFLFNKARMRSNSAHPEPEQNEIVDIPDPPLPLSSQNPHPFDDALDPALEALLSYERQFSYHFQYGDAIFRRSFVKFETCERLLQEQKVQERALEIARGNLDYFFKMIHQNYTDFMNCYSWLHRSHSNLLETFGRDKEKLRSIKIMPLLQTSECKCLLDFMREENLQKAWEDCSVSHKQLDYKVSEFKVEFGELKGNAERLFSDKASVLVKDLELSIRHHQQFINEQKSITQALSNDVNTVKKLMDDCLSCQKSSSLRPHDAVSALGPIYDSHEKSYLPKMQSSEHEISSLLAICREKKNEMNTYVHIFMQKISCTQYTIKGVRYKFSVFQEALMRQNDLFEQLKVVRRIGPTYRSCLAEVVRRRAAKKIYMGKAGQLAEKLASQRDAEVKRREEFLKVHSAYIPGDILASMGLYDIPNPCNVDVAPFDSNLLDIDLSDLERYAPESLLGLSLKSGKQQGTLRSSLSMFKDDSQTAEVEGAVELLEGSELVEIGGTNKMDLENAKLKSELASKIALICSMSAQFDYESLDDSKLDNILKDAADKTNEALRLKDEYERHLQLMLKVKQMQCDSYEKRVQELEQRLSDQHMRGCQLPADEDICKFVVSTTETDDNKSEVSGVGEVHMHRTMEDVYCASSMLKSGFQSEHDKQQEGLDDNMPDSSGIINPQLDSYMLDLDKKTTLLPDGGTVDRLVLQLQNALAEKSSLLDNAEAKIQELLDEVSKLERELDISRKLLDESQMNSARLENCLQESRKEAQTHLCTAECRVSEHSPLHVSTVKSHGLLETFRSCVSFDGAAFSDSLSALAQSLASESSDESTAEFRDLIQLIADKVGLLSTQPTELLERCSKAKDAHEQLHKELEVKKELFNTLYERHQLEKQANKDKISFNHLQVQEIAAFVLNSSNHYEAINRSCPYYYLSAESVALFSDSLPTRPVWIVGRVLHIEREVVKQFPSASDRAEYRGSTSNPYGLPVGCEYFIVTIGMLPDGSACSPPS